MLSMNNAQACRPDPFNSQNHDHNDPISTKSVIVPRECCALNTSLSVRLSEALRTFCCRPNLSNPKIPFCERILVEPSGLCPAVSVRLEQDADKFALSYIEGGSFANTGPGKSPVSNQILVWSRCVGGVNHQLALQRSGIHLLPTDSRTLRHADRCCGSDRNPF